ncbi:helix-turn-helix domain-containing protein [Streptomyces sp. P6-2-1]|uniref:helix-turn-helix domain-containing protein n=1 Tax=unclassified Streptomyces TaxID=2593676 RepID=UPI003D367545
MPRHDARTAAAAAARTAPRREPQEEQEGVDARAELSEFLRTRRDRLKPADVGLADYSRRRRVPGLRREELAHLAGVSAAYYTRFEQGNARNVSREVIDAISRVLRLSDPEHAHLLRLAQAGRTGQRPKAPRQRVRTELREMLAAMEGMPAYIWGRRSDVLAWNRTAGALFGDWDTRTPRELNWGRILFLDPASRKLFVDWETTAYDVVRQLRLGAGKYPDDALLACLIDELAAESEDFRRLWAAHDVKGYTHGDVPLSHPVVGELTLRYQSFAVADDQEQYLTTYHAAPGSPSERTLRSLADWSAGAAQEHPAGEPAD